MCVSWWENTHYSVGDAFSTCLRDVDVVAPIMVKGGAKVPGIDGVGGPCAPEGEFLCTSILDPGGAIGVALKS